MKKFNLFIATGAFLLFSCNTIKVIPLKGTYKEPPFTFTSTKNFQQVWDNLIDLFAQTGISIKLIDKSSGLIISNELVLKSTVEDKLGKLVNPLADVVVPLLYNKATMLSTPVNKDADITGEWNVRIKEITEGTLINVNLVNLKYYGYDSYRRIPVQTPLVYYKSTGRFEKMISDFLNK